MPLRLPFHDGRNLPALTPAELGDWHIRGVGHFAVRVVDGAARDAIDVQVVRINVGELDLRAPRRILGAEILPHGPSARFVVQRDVTAVLQTDTATGAGGGVADRPAVVAAAGGAGTLAVPGEDVAVGQRGDQRRTDDVVMVPGREGEIAAGVCIEAWTDSDGWVRAGSASVAVDGGIGGGRETGEEEKGGCERVRHCWFELTEFSEGCSEDR